MSRLLIVDDEEKIRQFCANTREFDGHQVVEAADAWQPSGSAASRISKLLS